MHFVHFRVNHYHVKYYTEVLVLGDKAYLSMLRQTQL